MAKQPKTTSEHIISLYGYITGLKREVSSIITYLSYHAVYLYPHAYVLDDYFLYY